MSGKRHFLAVVSALAVITAVGCGSSGGGSSGTTSTSTPSAGTGATTPIESLPAIDRMREQATACIRKTGTNGLLTASGRTELANCLMAIVPPAKRQAFKNCITTAATDDKIWTSDGLTKFTNTSLPDCLNQLA